MDKTRKLDKHNKFNNKPSNKHNKTKAKKKPHKYHALPVRYYHHQELWLPSTTPPNVHKIANQISNRIRDTGSYAPTINRDLTSLASIPREDIYGCNLEAAYQLKEPLKIEIPGKYGEDMCQEYYLPEAEEALLKNLKANKHVDPKKIVPPVQSHGNCWFNAFFVTFFVSDKGRKFFHFFRQLMIKGTQKDKTAMPDNLRDAFALLNYGVDNCLQGTDYAYELDTNSVIVDLFDKIPEDYKSKSEAIPNIDEAGNPMIFYLAIIKYLDNDSIQPLFLRGADNLWKEQISDAVSNMSHLPHFIVLEFFEDQAEKCNNKPVSFKINKAKYALDSAVVRDTEKEHFCALITCEGKQMGYDGMSFHRLVPFTWKNNVNSDITWKFEGSTHADDRPMEWNFRKSYQMLIFYRVE
jgi:hypothetical protein